MWTPASVSDVQMVLILIAKMRLRLEGFAWLLPTITAGFLAELFMLLIFEAVRHRIGTLMYPFGRLLFPVVNAAGALWAGLRSTTMVARALSEGARSSLTQAWLFTGSKSCSGYDRRSLVSEFNFGGSDHIR